MEKEDRRKKIVSRGDDRMALITGRLRSLDADPLPKSTSFTVPRPDSCPPQHVRSSSEPLVVEDQSLIAHHQMNDAHADRGNGPEKNQLEISKSKGQRGGKVWLQKVLSMLATPEQIILSINSTENTRAICSVMLAYLVLLCHVNLVDSKPKSFITYSPLGLVLLTDATLVVSTLLLCMRATREVEVETKVVGDEDEQEEEWGRIALKSLELVLVAYQMIRGVFIDCSLYVVIVVSGLSLVA